MLKLFAIFCVFTCILLAGGCSSELQDLRIQNDTQRKRIADLESQLQTATLQLEQLQRQLSTAREKGGVEAETLQAKVTALEEDLAKKNELIASLQQRLLFGGAQLPVELSTKLEDFAKKYNMVTYDASRGIVKFTSDLLFDKGSDNVSAEATKALAALCGILNSDEAKKFDIIIAGHTDDIPIRRPETVAKHPTNWYLSANRAIAVLEIMENNKIAQKRMSVRGFSEYRPIAPNKEGKGGNPLNRRVEVYIVPEGL
jgi:chemotaxis protein MotB